MEGNIVEAAAIIGKLIGAGLAAVGVLGGGIGVGLSALGATQAMGRNPDAAGTIQTNMILGFAFAEATSIYALVVALLILFVF